jgi:CCR4-NOT transcription complex subunit 1
MNPNIRQLVPHAVDRAIKEVISAVVERSVTISCLTTREMVTKDFAMDPDENVLKKAAQLMVSSVAGSLALATCREPLRVSLTNHLWQLLLPHCVTKDRNETAAHKIWNLAVT